MNRVMMKILINYVKQRDWMGDFIPNLEEIMYIFELLIKDIQYDKAITFLQMVKQLTNFRQLKEAETYEEKGKQSIKSVLCHVRNPIKLAVHLIYLV